MSPTQAKRIAAFTLIEVLVALTLATVALTLGLGLTLQQRRLDQSLRADEVAMRAIEASLESIRAGALPLQSGELLPPAAYPPDPTSRDLRLSLIVQPTTIPDLFEINIDAQFTVRERLKTRTMQTMVWRP